MGAALLLTVEEALAGVTRLGLDTSPLIYFIEESGPNKPALDAILGRIVGGQLEGVTSVVTLTEVLVHPLLQKKPDLARQYRELILESRHLRVVSITSAVAERAAHLRADHNLRTPDALQLSAALEVGCEAFLTNDTRFKRVAETQILLLNELTAV